MSVFILAGLIYSTAGVGVAHAVSKREKRLHTWINRERADRGIRRLKLSASLSRKARRHSANMAAGRQVAYHSCLSCTLRSYSYRIAGENVGAGSRLRRIHRAFMRSRAHRKNILRSGFRKVGTGVVKSDGRLWVTEIFIG